MFPTTYDCAKPDFWIFGNYSAAAGPKLSNHLIFKLAKPLKSGGSQYTQTCLCVVCVYMHISILDLINHSWGMAFTWKMRYLVIEIPVYMMITVSRFLIICV